MLVLAKLKKFSLLWLKWALGLAVSLSIVGCRPLKAGKTCNLSAEGLRGSAYQGGLLPDLQLSLAFLRGPSEITEQIGGFLEQRSIQATFFVKGAAVFKREGELQRLRDQGHLIGHGGFSFTPFQQTRQAVLDIRKADELISPYTTGNMFLLHAPDGRFSAGLASMLNRQGLGKYLGPIEPDTVSQGSFVDDAICWQEGVSVSNCAQQYFVELVRLRRGLIAFHDEDQQTLDLLSILLPQLQAYGFQFVRLDQIPDIREALLVSGSTVDEFAGEASCNDYK